jgi:hypothetical protein
LNTWRGEQWTSCQTISTVLLTLCTLLCENPLLNEPGVTREHYDFKNYTSIVEHSNIKIAICDIIDKKQGIYLSFFELFYHYVQENFLKNYDDLMQFIENKNKEKKPKQMITTKLYDLSIEVDYKLLQNRIIECREKMNTVKK